MKRKQEKQGSRVRKWRKTVFRGDNIKSCRKAKSDRNWKGSSDLENCIICNFSNFSGVVRVNLDCRGLRSGWLSSQGCEDTETPPWTEMWTGEWAEEEAELGNNEGKEGGRARRGRWGDMEVGGNWMHLAWNSLLLRLTLTNICVHDPGPSLSVALSRKPPLNPQTIFGASAVCSQQSALLL